MRLAIFGENRGPQHRALVSELLRSFRPDHLVVLLRQGLGKVAHDAAVEMGIPVLRFGHVRKTVAGGHRMSRSGNLLRGSLVFRGSVELAVSQAAATGKPDLVVCIAPRRAATHRGGRRYHEEMVHAFRSRGIRCLVGRFDKARKVTWSSE
jgi:hypothetical protein